MLREILFECLGWIQLTLERDQIWESAKTLITFRYEKAVMFFARFQLVTSQNGLFFTEIVIALWKNAPVEVLAWIKTNLYWNFSLSLIVPTY
jgi:hypothetical protein